MLSGLRVPLPQLISEELVSSAPDELGRGEAGRRADEADLIPSGEGLGLGVNYYRRSLCGWRVKNKSNNHDSGLHDVICNFPMMRRTTVGLKQLASG